MGYQCGVHCSCSSSVGQTASLPKLREVSLCCEVKREAGKHLLHVTGTACQVAYRMEDRSEGGKTDLWVAESLQALQL